MVCRALIARRSEQTTVCGGAACRNDHRLPGEHWRVSAHQPFSGQFGALTFRSARTCCSRSTVAGRCSGHLGSSLRLTGPASPPTVGLSGSWGHGKRRHLASAFLHRARPSRSMRDATLDNSSRSDHGGSHREFHSVKTAMASQTVGPKTSTARQHTRKRTLVAAVPRYRRRRGNHVHTGALYQGHTASSSRSVRRCAAEA